MLHVRGQSNQELSVIPELGFTVWVWAGLKIFEILRIFQSTSSYCGILILGDNVMADGRQEGE